MTDVQVRYSAEETGCLSSFFRIFPSQCIPEASEEFDVPVFVYSTPFCNKFTVDETLNVASSADRH
jgi:hypothetical protein